MLSIELIICNIKKSFNSNMRKKNCKLRDYPLQGAKINCARFSRKKIQYDQNPNSSLQRHQYFVTGDNQNNIRFYEFLDESEHLSFNSNSNNNTQSEVSAVAISWEQISIFSGSNRGIINVWDIQQGKNSPVCTLKGHATSVNCFGLFPENENLIASGSYDTQIKIWDHRKKENIATFKGHTKQINSIDISPDGRYLLSASQDGSSKFWDIGTQKIINTYSEHTAPVLKAIFNPQDCIFASCSSDRTAKLFSCDISMKNLDYISSTQLVSMPITAIDFSPDGKFLCTGGNDFMKIWQMRKNGLLLQSVESAWKGVLQLIWCDNGIKGVSSHGGNLSIWYCYLGEKKQSPQKKEEQENLLKLPKIAKNPSIRKENSSRQEERKIKPSENINFNNKILSENKEDRSKDLEEIMNNINFALGQVNSLEKNKKQKDQGFTKDAEREKQKQRQRQRQKQKQKERKEQERAKQQERKERIRLQKEKEREERETRQRERRQKLIREKEEQEKRRQQKQIQMQKERQQRQRLLQIKLQQTFQNNEKPNYQMTIQNDLLQNSSMNLSLFMGDGVQKQKLLQIQAIGELMKDSGKFQSVYKTRSSYVKPIIYYWKQGKIDSALYTISQADTVIAFECISAIIKNSTFKLAITPDVACSFIKKLIEIMKNKHSIYVTNAMVYLNEIVLMFKDELIKVKMFNPMTRVDLSREERLAKYDRLTDQFLNVFNQERLKKYALLVKSPENQEIHKVALELYQNLEQVLRKIMPKKQPEAA